MSHRDHWGNVYASKSETAVSWYQPLPTLSLRWILAARSGDPPSVVDVGSGASTLIDALLDAGVVDVTAVDVAATAFERAKQRLGPRASAVTWTVADLTSWEPPRSYDVWHDRAVFHFLTDAEARDGYRRALARGTRPGATVILATFAEDGPETCSGLPVRRYSASFLAAELGGLLVPLEHANERHVTPWGSEQPFTYVRFRRV